MSVLIFSLMLFYGSIKFVHMISRANPALSQYKALNALDSDKVVDLNAENKRFAFGVEGYLDGETKYDPRFVKYLVRTVGQKDGVGYDKLLDYHVCTAEELDSYGKPSSTAAFPL